MIKIGSKLRLTIPAGGFRKTGALYKSSWESTDGSEKWDVA